MKKIKKIVSILLILMLCSQSFAAIVSENDGFTFITKEEFDTLKEDLSKQIDAYNSSISGKIDGAIASYLAGVQMNKSESIPLIFSTWDDVSCMNCAIAPSYVKPTVDACFDLVYAWATPWQYINGVNARNGAWSIQLSIKNKQSAADHAMRPLVTGNTEDDQEVDAVWNGIALSYDEYFTIFKTATQIGGAWLMWIDGPLTYEYGGTLIDALKFNASGTYTNNEDIVNEWKPSLYWKYREKGTAAWLEQNIPVDEGAVIGKVCSLSAVLSKVSDDTKIYEHIIQYDGTTKWRVSNETFTKTLRQPDDSTIYGKTILGSATKKSNNWSWGQLISGTSNVSLSEGNKRVNLSATGGTMAIGLNASDGSVVDNTTTIWPVVGMLKNDLAAKKIKLIKDDVDISGYKTKTSVVLKSENLTLEKGFPLFYVEKNTIVEWLPEFEKYLKWDSTSSSFISQTDKITLALSYGPFTDKMTTSKPVLFKTNTETTLEGTHTVELSGSKISFEPQEDNIIYAKWVPDTTSYTSDIWISKLLLKDCNNYAVTKID